MNHYRIASRDGFCFVHGPDSFEAVCGYHGETADAIRVRDLLNMTAAASDAMVYDNRQAIASILGGIRRDIREFSDCPETRHRACALRDLLDIAESRLKSVVHP
jgi:hypothetical protein